MNHLLAIFWHTYGGKDAWVLVAFGLATSVPQLVVFGLAEGFGLWFASLVLLAIGGWVVFLPSAIWLMDHKHK